MRQPVDKWRPDPKGDRSGVPGNTLLTFAGWGSTLQMQWPWPEARGDWPPPAKGLTGDN